MKTRANLTSILTDQRKRKPASLWMAACLAIAGVTTAANAAPPSPADDIDYAASGFQLPAGVNPSAWSTAAGVSAIGGMNFASQPAISGPMMQAPPMGSPMSMMQMGMPGMGPNGPIMGRPGMEGPMYQNQIQQVAGASSIPASFPSGPIPGMGVVPTGLQAPMGPAAYQVAMQAPYGVMPVGYHQATSCDAGYAMECCESCGCGGAAAPRRGFRGLLPALTGGNGGGCSSCASKSLQNDCIGYGGVFGDLANGSCLQGDLGLMLGAVRDNLAGVADCLSPYTEAGKCAQRWYDISAEYMGLTSNLSQGNQVFTTRNIAGTPELSLSDVEGGDLASGVRLSAAVILGVGGNLEVTYMGGHEWSNSATAVGIAGVGGVGDLYSYISGFGVTPNEGYDDTDRSLSQSLSAKSRFHSGELNYRRRIVGPYCKFQGSWLFGMRYMRFDNDLIYRTVGSFDDGAGVVGTVGGDLGTELRFFSSDVRTKNDYFGAQLGYDFWWNVQPGLQFGVELKGAWMQNDWERNYVLTANSAGPGATAGTAQQSDRDRTGTIMGELQTTLLYRFSHEWTFRSSYHLMGIDDVLGNTLAAENITGAVDGNAGTIAVPAPVEFNTAVLQGFTVGLEYLW